MKINLFKILFVFMTFKIIGIKKIDDDNVFIKSELNEAMYRHASSEFRILRFWTVCLVENHLCDKIKKFKNADYDVLWAWLMNVLTKLTLWNKWKINDINEFCDKSLQMRILFVKEL